MKRFILALVTAMTLALCGTAAADLPACTTTASSASGAASAVSAASPGDTVCLADGSYSKITLSANKSAPGVTLRAENPGQATVNGFYIDGRNLTVAQFSITDEVTIRPPGGQITVDHNRITGGYMGVNLWTGDSPTIDDTKITGNKFVGPFGEDGVRANGYHDGDGDGAGLLVSGNEFTGIVENGNHSDCYQSVWRGDSAVFSRNYLHDNHCQGFFVKDQATAINSVVGEDNLMVRNNLPCTAGQPNCNTSWMVQLFGPISSLRLAHNTVIGSGGGDLTLRNTGWSGPRVVQDNVVGRAWSDTSAPFGSGYSSSGNLAATWDGTWPSTGFTQVASPPFADPAHDDYRLASGQGVTWAPAEQQYGPGGSSPPPPPPPADTDGDGVPDSSDQCPTEAGPAPSGCPAPPPADAVPAARYIYSPSRPRVGRWVTFDGTTTTCDDSPCQFHWQDDGSDGAGGTNWPLGDGSVLRFKFSGAGTKNIRLIVTDKDGDTDSVVKAISVRR